MKKILFAFGLGITLVASAFAGDENSLSLLNSEIVNILAPWQNSATQAALRFKEIEMNSEHVLKVGLNGLYSKKGLKNNLEVRVDNLSYDYKDGKSPTTFFKGALGTDITKFCTPQECNDLIPQVISLLEDATQYYVGYGDAAVVNGTITSTAKDSDGNYTGFSALLAIKVDLNQLPADMPRNEVFITDAVFSLALNFKTGITLDAFVTMNPSYLGFEADQLGLKEALEHLLSRDDDVKEMIEDFFTGLDDLATTMDNASSFWHFISLKKTHLLH